MKFSRIFIEKKVEVNTEAKKLYNEFKNYLAIDGLEKVRFINIYDLVNTKDEDREKIVDDILYEAQLDKLYRDFPVLKEDELAFRVQFLKGQFNQREESIKELLKFLDLKEEVEILNSYLIILKGVSREELDKIKSYYINPIEMEEVDLHKLTYEKEEESLDSIEVIEGFNDFSPQAMEEFKGKYGIGLDMDDLLFCQDYFRSEKRNPYITEIKLIDTYWSDHCRHTTFTTEIKDIRLEEGKYKEVFERTINDYLESRKYVYENRERAVTFMDLATINMKEIAKKGLLEDKEVSDEINAASIEIDVDVDGNTERWLLMFKNETHNHPTEMEPFGGAGTCLGGAIRDPLSGRSFVYQAMRITGAADPRRPYEETLAGKLPQRKITLGAMEGYSSYGNEIGAATGYVKEIYDEGFLAKRMECGALVAAAPKDWVYRGKSEAGDLIILIGGRTGRDGLGGAVGSSREHTEESLHTSGAEVQKGNPSLERKILRLFRKENVSKMIKVCNDFGAGGVGVAIGELADGLSIKLDQVPLKYPGLDGTEIALSESQERMAVVIDEENLDSFMAEVANEDLEATVVAKVTEEKVLKMLWKNEEIVNIKRSFLDTNGRRKTIEVEIGQPMTTDFMDSLPIDLDNKSMGESLKELVRDLNIGSQKGLVENFDSSVGAGTVLMPYGGSHQLSPSEGMVAKIPVLEGDTKTCSIMTYGYEPKISKWSPFHGGYYAVIESVAKVVALGGDYRKVRLSMQEYFERLGEDKLKWGKPLASLLGAYLVQKELDIPSIGGKDSMSGSFEDLDVPPTLISFAVTAADVENIISNEFKSPKNQVILLELGIDEEGLLDFTQLRDSYDRVRDLIKAKKIISAQTIKYGGLARTILEMSFGNKIGFSFNNIDRESLFKALYGSLVLEVEESVNVKEAFLGLNYKILGTTIDREEIIVDNETIKLDDLIRAWESPLREVFPIVREEIGEVSSYSKDKNISIISSKTQAKVLIPVFTGSHGEYSMGQAFQRAGGQVESFVFKSLNKKYIEESFKELAEKIKESQIIGFPHGAVLGNEPETGGKLLKLILTNPLVEEAINQHLELNKGLILGIGNGFQGLIKAGLISKGKVSKDNQGPLLARNQEGGFMSTMVDLVVKSNRSPWMANMEKGQIYTTALASMEGRIILDRATIAEDQVASKFAWKNPTGSEDNIESLTSPDGRVLGTITAIDRIGQGLYKNIDIKNQHNIFDSGIKYFD